MRAPLSAHKSMQLIDDDILKRFVHARNRSRSIDKHRFERFGCRQNDAARILNELRLGPLPHVSVPTVNGDFGSFAKFFQPAELVIDKGF